jgi:hypothetical protein
MFTRATDRRHRSFSLAADAEHVTTFLIAAIALCAGLVLGGYAGGRAGWLAMRMAARVLTDSSTPRPARLTSRS